VPEAILYKKKSPEEKLKYTVYTEEGMSNAAGNLGAAAEAEII
jgi:hypothetical protein